MVRLHVCKERFDDLHSKLLHGFGHLSFDFDGQLFFGFERLVQGHRWHLRADAVIDVRGDLLVGIVQPEEEGFDVGWLGTNMVHDGGSD